MLVARLLAGFALMAVSIFTPHVIAWTLHADPEVFALGTLYKLEIFCNLRHSESPAPFSAVHNMHITKFDSEGGSQTLASIDFGTGNVTTIDSNFVAYRYTRSYGLGIESTKIRYALGKYGCVITGLDKLDKILQISLPPMTVEAEELTTGDVLERCQKIKSELRSFVYTSIRGIEQKIYKVKGSFQDLKSEIQSNFTSISSTVGDLGLKLDTGLKELNEKVNETQKQKEDDKPKPTSSPQTPWPMGSYALYEPLSGCPSSEWKNAWVKFATESERPSQSNASSGNHFQTPLFTTQKSINIANLRFCVHSNEMSSVPWPKGSYCIQDVKSGNCPTGFGIGTIAIDLDDDHTWHNYTENIGVEATDDFIYVRYCCRIDASPSSPISLPKDKPFYLFRFRDVCQEVEGMTASHESMLIDTEKDNNGDLFIDGNYHPDATLNPINLHLCYYTENKE